MDPVLGFDVQLPATGSGGLVRSIYRQIREHISAGRLQPGVPLPSSRQLARALHISRNSAIAVYDLLASEGCVVTRAGGGTFVANVFRSQQRRPPPIRAPTSRSQPDPRLPAPWRDLQPPAPLGPDAQALYDFSLGVPSLEHFPFAVWRRVYVRALRSLARASAAYSDPRGLMQLRTAIAHHVSFTRSVSCDAEDVLVCSGAQQAFDLIAKVFIEPGVSIAAVEDPGYPPLRRALQSARARLIPVRVDSDGIVVKDIPPDARLIFVTPSHQFPLGTTMSYARRQALLEHAYRTRAIVIEDDYDGEFRHSTRPVDALQTLDRRATVFYVGTFSKSIFPGLRLGYIVSPAWARNALAAAKLGTDWHSDTLHQAALAEFIREGHLTRHIRKSRRLYTERYNSAVEALTKHFGDQEVRVLPAAAGLHVTCTVASRRLEQSLAAMATTLGLRVTPLAQFYLREPHIHGLALGLGRASAQNISQGLSTLGRHLVTTSTRRGRATRIR